MTSRHRGAGAAGSGAAASYVGGGRRGVRDWAALAVFAPLSAPFLLRGLLGGGRARRLALLERLGLPSEALPRLGSWRADARLLQLVADHVLAEKPATIVELGGGVSTLVVARAVQLAGADTTFVSVDHDPRFSAQAHAWLAEHGLGADLRTALLKPAPAGWPGLWYDCAGLPEPVDLMLVDGPPWTIHPFTRGAAETLFDRLRVGGVVMLDDANRPGERVVARRWRRRWPNFEFERLTGGKGTLVGRRLR